MLKRLAILLSLTFAGANLLSAATYYVAKTGSDSNVGSQSAPWLTIQKAANTVKAGDTVNLGAGTYSENVTITASGSVSGSITFVGPQTAVLAGRLTMQGAYLNWNGTTISPPSAITAYNESEYGVLMDGQNETISNAVYTGFGAVATDQATMIVLGVNSSFCTVSGVTFKNMNDIDVFHVWGHDHLISHNLVTNINEVNYAANHTDFVQTWAGPSYNVIIDGNVMVNSSAQIGNTECDPGTPATLHDWTFRNNIFANGNNNFYSGIPNTKFYNNVFYNIGTGNGAVVMFYTDNTVANRRSSAGSAFANNLLIGSPMPSLAGPGPSDYPSANTQNNYTGLAALVVNAAGFDFHPLAVATALIGKGMNISPAFPDKDGNPRPASGAWDIGAYVYGGTNTGGGGGGGGNNIPPTVSAVTQNASDVDPITAGVQVYEGTTVQYSAAASVPTGDGMNWAWSYTVNGGSSVNFQNGTGTTVPGVSYTYPTGAGGQTYVWTLTITDTTSLLTAQSSLTMSVEAPPAAGTNLTFQAGQYATLTAPFVLSGGYISQPVQTTVVSQAGQATYNFTITNAGSYVVQALVNAPGDSANSMYVNIDALPVDPTMCWDMQMTSGFQQRIVSWRGNGTDTNNQFVPEVFNLAAGNHQIVFAGREAGVQLQSFSILQLLSAPQNLHVLPTVVASPTFSAGGQ